jgi:hypothetical protein
MGICHRRRSLAQRRLAAEPAPVGVLFVEEEGSRLQYFFYNPFDN